jgi:hypothetical protein
MTTNIDSGQSKTVQSYGPRHRNASRLETCESAMHP